MWNNKHETSDDIEKIFHMEEREKRRGGFGAFHNSGRRGGSLSGIKGSLHMPCEWLKGQNKEEYKKYIGGSDVILSNVYEDINNLPTLKEMKAKDYESAHTILKTAKGLHKSAELVKYWHTSSGTLYGMYDKFGVEYPKKPRRNKKEMQNGDTPKTHPKVVGAITDSNASRRNKKDTNNYLSAPAYVPDKQIAPEMKSLLQENAEYQAHMDFKEELKYQELLKEPVTYVPEEKIEQYQLNYNPKEATGKEIQDRIMGLMGILYTENKYKVELTITELPSNENK